MRTECTEKHTKLSVRLKKQKNERKEPIDKFTGKATGDMNMQMNMNIQIKDSILRFGFFRIGIIKDWRKKCMKERQRQKRIDEEERDRDIR